MNKRIAFVLSFLLGCEQRADVGDLPSDRGDAGPRDGSTTIPGTGLLKDGDFPGALVGYEGGTTPGDAFGACFARTLLLVERPEVDSALVKLGQPPLSAAQLLGPQSVPARIARSWSGSGDLTLGAPVNKSVHFDRAKAVIAGVDARSYRTGAQAWVSFNSATEPPPTAGARAVFSYDCGTGQLSSTTPYNGIDYRDPDWFCSLPSTVPVAGCTVDAGMIEVLEAGSSPGTRWRARVDNLLLACRPRDDFNATTVPTRVSGELTGPAASLADRTGLHPWLEGWLDNDGELPTLLGATTAGTTFESVLRALYPLTNELSRAATDCERAGQGSGVVFRIPGELWAGDPLSVTAGDALILAGLLRGLGTMLQFSSGYEHSFVLGGVCSASTCIDDATLVQQLNAAMPINRFPQSFTTAKAEFDRALTSMIAGIDALGADSLFARNSETQAGLAFWRGWMTTAKASLASGRAALDGFTPLVAIDLAALFASPPTPASASVDPWIYDATLGRAEFVESFYDEVFKRHVDITAGSDYAGPGDAITVLQAADDQFGRAGFTLNE